MRRTRAQGRKDANHKELVDYWRSLGGSWQDTCEIPGALDGIAGMNGIDVRVEIKDGSKPKSTRRLTDAEQIVFNSWRGRKPVVWENDFDVNATYNALLPF